MWCSLHFTRLLLPVDVMQFAFHTFSSFCWCDALCISHFYCFLLIWFSLHFTLLVPSVDVMHFAFHTFFYGLLMGYNLYCTLLLPFVASALGLSTDLWVRQSCLFPASSIKFLTRRTAKSLTVYLAPHADNSIKLLSTVSSRMWKNNNVVHLITLTYQIAVSHMIRIVDVTHVSVLSSHEVRFHWAVAVVTKISFCWWWVHVSQHVNFLSVLPN